jgi:hypothetical protein
MKIVNPIRFEKRNIEVRDLFLLRAAIVGLEMSKSNKILQRFFKFVFYERFNINMCFSIGINWSKRSFHYLKNNTDPSKQSFYFKNLSKIYLN